MHQADGGGVLGSWLVAKMRCETGRMDYTTLGKSAPLCIINPVADVLLESRDTARKSGSPVPCDV